MLNLALKNRFQIEVPYGIFFYSLGIKGSESLTYDSSGNIFCFGDWVHILYFDKSFHIILEHPSEVVLELVSSKILQYNFPIWRVFKLP